MPYPFHAATAHAPASRVYTIGAAGNAAEFGFPARARLRIDPDRSPQPGDVLAVSWRGRHHFYRVQLGFDGAAVLPADAAADPHHWACGIQTRAGECTIVANDDFDQAGVVVAVLDVAAPELQPA